MKNKKGFTLIELLAVIAILAILVIIALPNIINTYNEARKQTFITEAKKIYTEAGKKFVTSSISGSPVKVINSEDESKLDMTGKKLQYCIILDNSGNVKSMKVSNGQWIASLDGNKQIEDLATDDLTDGNLDGYNCSNNTPTIPEPLNCKFDGELVQGAEYVNGQYTYRYMQEYNIRSADDLTPNASEMTTKIQDNINKVSLLNNVEKMKYTSEGWFNITTDGWGVVYTDKNNTNPVTTKLCTTINNKPLVSMSYMFYNAKASSIDLSAFKTDNVVNMKAMFYSSNASSLDLSSFDTSKVTDMRAMFANNSAKTLKLNSFNTSNVTSMEGMFYGSKATTLGIQNFNTSKVTNMKDMFRSTVVIELDLRDFDTSSVSDMNGMFSGNSNLTTIYTSNKFILDKVIDSAGMFNSSQKLVGGAGTVYDSAKTDATYAHIDGGTSNPGYFTLKQ